MTIKGAASHTLISITSLLFTAGFLVWSALHVSGMIWHIIARDAELSAFSGHSELGVERRTPVVREADLGRLQAVFALTQLGRSTGVSAVADASVGSAADTRLALTLRGAVLSSDPSRSRAIIAYADSQSGYQPGDRLLDTPGTVLVQEIHQRYVMLDNNGRLEILRMDEAIPAAVTGVTDSVASSSQTAGILPASIDRASALTDLLRIQPVFEDEDSARAGELRGLQIRDGSSHDFLIAVGLQRGDLITAVDGKELKGVADLSVLMTQLSTQQTVSLQVLRDQTQINIVLDRSRW